MEKKTTPQKYPCPDCAFCQCCSEARCSLCRPSSGKKKKKDSKALPHKPLFLKF